jgi:hypothetical protein
MRFENLGAGRVRFTPGIMPGGPHSGAGARRSFGQVRCDLLLQTDPSALGQELVTS